MNDSTKNVLNMVETNETLTGNIETTTLTGSVETSAFIGSLNYFKGDSAFECWLKQDGNEGKTFEDFMNELNIDLTGYATIEYVDEQINNVESGSGYVTKVDLEKKLDEYITETELSQKGYLTEHQDISHLAPKTYVDNLIETHTHEEYLTEHQDISHLATQTFVNERISQIEPGMSDSEREQLDKNTNDISTILSIIDTPPTYTNPTLNIGFSTSTLEHDKRSSVVITPTFNQNDAGSVTSYTLYRGGVKIFNGSSVTSFTDTVTMSHNTSTVYNATVSYGDGSIKDTLLGIPYPNTSIKAGSISKSGTIKAYALSYYGVIDASTITENDISSLSSRLSTNRLFTNTVSLTRQRIIYMYPKSFGALTSIKDANNFDYINSYTRTSLTHNSVDYYVYILTDPVTITGFKQIFN